MQKLLRTLPIAYNPKVCTLEYREMLGELIMDELYGILIAYELRLGIDNNSKGEATFKVTKKIKNQRQVFGKGCPIHLFIHL